MLDTVIKNTILFLLIILILHFLINNVLVEMKITTKSSEMNDEIDGSFDIEEYQPEEDNYLWLSESMNYVHYV